MKCKLSNSLQTIPKVFHTDGKPRNNRDLQVVLIFSGDKLESQLICTCEPELAVYLQINDSHFSFDIPSTVPEKLEEIPFVSTHCNESEVQTHRRNLSLANMYRTASSQWIQDVTIPVVDIVADPFGSSFKIVSVKLPQLKDFAQQNEEVHNSRRIQ